jgi:hypothetical protein
MDSKQALKEIERLKDENLKLRGALNEILAAYLLPSLTPEEFKGIVKEKLYKLRFEGKLKPQF